ncbi:MAG: NAD(P)/FAD-dependent oxidoreductase [Verrucomicrobia bacterium]|nr:NAD(P)/FAD-dependent oxidoreductase [Verrucomicrobiota bacterium]
MSASRKPCDYDVAILGGGSAGYAAARTAAGAGLKTVVIEGGAEVGGLCILRGCMPSKALLYAAEVLHLARHADTWGIKVKSAGFDFTRVMQRKTQRIAEFADHRRQQLASGKFKFIRANARFVDSHTLEMPPLRAATVGPDLTQQPADASATTDAGKKTPAGWRASKPGGQVLTARHFVIATGSVVSPPPLPALAAVGCITSDHALSLKRLPKSLIILGGGAIACELAQFFARLDVKVTMIQRSSHILREFDADAAAVIEPVLRRDGVKLFTGTKLLDAGRDGAGKSVTFEHSGKKVRVRAEEILLSLGRSPNTAGLGLEQAGVELDHGRIITNAGMQTSTPHIFAAGDCTGPHEIVHIAIQQAEIAAHNISASPRRPRAMDYRLLTSVVFTEPQVATVGLTEKEATARGTSFLTASHPFSRLGKSLIMEALDGFVKLLANPQTGEILGGACVGPVGGELIHEIVTAMAKRMTVHELAVTPHYHPTLAEIWTFPAEELAEKIPARTSRRERGN